MDTKKSRVLIVDDHPVVRQGLVQCINEEDDLIVCGDVEDAETAIKLINELKPDIVIADLTLKGTGGLDLTSAIKERFSIPVLILSMHDENFYAERAIRAGAKGYIMKRESMDLVFHAVREILQGRIYLSNAIKDRLLGKFLSSGSSDGTAALESLSNREMDVFISIGQGLSNRHIAEKLSLSVKTIETYRSRIMQKLNFSDSVELVQYAIEWHKNNDAG